MCTTPIGLHRSYYYDANGARAKTVEGSTTTEYVYGGHDPICDKVGSAYTDYVYLDGRLKLKIVVSDRINQLSANQGIGANFILLRESRPIQY